MLHREGNIKPWFDAHFILAMDSLKLFTCSSIKGNAEKDYISYVDASLADLWEGYEKFKAAVLKK